MGKQAESVVRAEEIVGQLQPLFDSQRLFADRSRVWISTLAPGSKAKPRESARVGGRIPIRACASAPSREESVRGIISAAKVSGLALFEKRISDSGIAGIA